MNEKIIFDQILKQVDWIKGVIKKRKWDLTQDLILEKPASLNEINEVEKQLGLIIPDDYKALFKFSRHVEFRYQFEEVMPSEFRSNFSGEIYWNLDRLIEQMSNFKEWVIASLDLKCNDTNAIEITNILWENKIPMIEVPNGDMIVIGNNPSEVVYFSHEGDSMHGKILGDNLFEFLDFHSKVGFVGSEDWQFEPFYDFKTDKMITKGEIIDKYIDWLNK